MAYGWLQCLVLISAGFFLGLISMIVGAWVMYRGKATSEMGQGFIKNPKGEVFTVTDGLDEAGGFPGNEEPSEEEKNILKRTEQFLKKLGGENA